MHRYNRPLRKKYARTRLGETRKDQAGHQSNTEQSDEGFDARDGVPIQALRVHITVTHTCHCLNAEKERAQKTVLVGIGNRAGHNSKQQPEYSIQRNIGCNRNADKFGPRYGERPVIEVRPDACIQPARYNLARADGNASFARRRFFWFVISRHDGAFALAI